MSSLASQICQTRALLEVLNHATLSYCVRRSVVCIPNMSTFRAFRSLCVSLCLLARLYTAIHRPPAQTHLHRRRLDQTAFGFAFVKTCVAHVACKTLNPGVIVLQFLRIYMFLVPISSSGSSINFRAVFLRVPQHVFVVLIVHASLVIQESLAWTCSEHQDSAES